jgi:hypothetical protein
MLRTVSATTTRHAHDVLASALRAATRRGLQVSSAIRDVPPPRRSSPLIETLTRDERCDRGGGVPRFTRYRRVSLCRDRHQQSATGGPSATWVARIAEGRGGRTASTCRAVTTASRDTNRRGVVGARVQPLTPHSGSHLCPPELDQCQNELLWPYLDYSLGLDLVLSALLGGVIAFLLGLARMLQIRRVARRYARRERR